MSIDRRWMGLLGLGLGLIASADPVGRVMFVSGDAWMIDHQGQMHRLSRGDLIGTEQRLSTGAGYLQVRMDHGAALSLQPETLVGIGLDDHHLRLLHGALRSEASVQTLSWQLPVGDVEQQQGVCLMRASGLTAGLQLGRGRAWVHNDHGSLHLRAGQAAAIADADAAPWPSEEMAAVLPPPRLPDQTPALIAASEEMGSTGLPLGLTAPAVLTLTSSSASGPFYNLLIAGNPAGSAMGGRLQAQFDTPSGALLTASSVSSPLFSAGTLQVSHLQNETVLSLGEFNAGDSLWGGVIAAQNQYVPYLVGIASGAPSASGSVSYSLANATDASTVRQYNAVTGTSTSGSVKQFTLTLDLTHLQVSLDLLLSMTVPSGASGSSTTPSPGYEVKVTQVAVPTLVRDSGFNLSNLPVTGTGVSDCGSGCLASVSGFWTGTNGSRLGTDYSIAASDGAVLGVAALTQSGAVTPSSTSPLISSSQGQFSLATPWGTIPAAQESNALVYNGLPASFASNGALQNIATGGSNSHVLLANTGGWQVTGLTTLDSLSLGEFTQGSGNVGLGDTGVVGSQTLDGTTFLPYIVGTSGTPGDPLLGRLHYSLQAATPARLNRQQGGSLDSLTLDLDLQKLQMDVNGQVSIHGSSWQVQGSGLGVGSLAQGAGWMLNGLGVSGPGCSSGSACWADVGGFLAGGTQMGVAYAVNLSSNRGVISGVAALQQTPLALALSSSFGAPATSVQDNLSVAVDPQQTQGGMVSATQGGSTWLARTTGTTVTDLGGDGQLEWGRWVGGTPVVAGNTATQALSTTDALHYVLGQETPTTMMNTLALQSGQVRYHLEGGTSPTNGTAVGQLKGASLQVDFAQATLTINVQVAMGAQAYTVQDGGHWNVGSPLFNLSHLATAGTGGACQTACYTQVSGLFAGSQANHVGLSYAITDGASNTRGVAGLAR